MITGATTKYCNGDIFFFVKTELRENWFPFLFPWKYVLIRQFQRDLGKKLTTICGCSINFLANDYLPIYGIAPLVKNILNYYEQMHEKHILTRFYLDNWEITWLLGKSWFWIFWNKKKMNRYKNMTKSFKSKRLLFYKYY